MCGTRCCTKPVINFRNDRTREDTLNPSGATAVGDEWLSPTLPPRPPSSFRFNEPRRNSIFEGALHVHEFDSAGAISFQIELDRKKKQLTSPSHSSSRYPIGTG